jgi:hypothetical protein
MKAKGKEILGVITICAILMLLIGLFVAGLATGNPALY